MFICLLLLLLTLVCENQIVISGARYGLMLWFHDVLPLLLPFMILSNLFVLELRKKKTATHYTIPVLLLLGLLCGYPLGAKMASDFSSEGMLDQKKAARLLPLCNNISPMFLSGYIGHTILNDQYTFQFLLFVLYLPYIFVFLLTYLFDLIRRHRSTSTPTLHTCTNSLSTTATSISGDSILLQSVLQITYVGLYIMLCSILFQLLCSVSFLPEQYQTLFCGFLEITQGSAAISTSAFSPAKKTALILACTSFGGISAFLQTIQVTKKSRLSIWFYLIVKLICGCLTGLLTYFLVI